MHTRSQILGVGYQKFVVKILFSVIFLLLSVNTKAQCAMCRAALDNDANVEQAKAVNDGIVFLMAVPYLLVALVGYFVYKMRKIKSKT